MMDITYRGAGGNFDFAVRAVILRDGHVLMVRAWQGDFYYTVGGRVQLHESAAQAALREAEEETGALFEVERLLFIHENFFGGNSHDVSLIYLMRHTGGEIRAATDSGEELIWIPVERLGEYKIFPVFFAEELRCLSNEIKHYVTRE